MKDIVSHPLIPSLNDTIYKHKISDQYNILYTHMDEKSLQTLELPLVLAQLANHCNFSASHELALQLQPTTDLREAQGRQQETTSARLFLKTHPQSSIGSARDVRSISERAARNATLLPNELVEIKNTLSAARVLKTVILTTNEDYMLLQSHST